MILTLLTITSILLIVFLIVSIIFIIKWIRLKKSTLTIMDVAPEHKSQSITRYRYECSMKLLDTLKNYITVEGGKVWLTIIT